MKSARCAVNPLTLADVMIMTRKKTTNKPVAEFRRHLFDVMRENAKGLTAAQFIDALYRASEDIWSAGIDDAYARLHNTNDPELGSAFDITWLTQVSIHLKKLSPKRR